MSPADKLQFLEKFAFQTVNLGDIKIRCKSLIARREMELKKTSALLESAISYLKEIDEPVPVEFPLKCKNKDIAIQRFDTLISELNIVINNNFIGTP